MNATRVTFYLQSNKLYLTNFETNFIIVFPELRLAMSNINFVDVKVDLKMKIKIYSCLLKTSDIDFGFHEGTNCFNNIVYVFTYSARKQ